MKTQSKCIVVLMCNLLFGGLACASAPPRPTLVATPSKEGETRTDLQPRMSASARARLDGLDHSRRERVLKTLADVESSSWTVSEVLAIEDDLAPRVMLSRDDGIAGAVDGIARPGADDVVRIQSAWLLQGLYADTVRREASLVANGASLEDFEVDSTGPLIVREWSTTFTSAVPDWLQRLGFSPAMTLAGARGAVAIATTAGSPTLFDGRLELLGQVLEGQGLITEDIFAGRATLSTTVPFLCAAVEGQLQLEVGRTRQTIRILGASKSLTRTIIGCVTGQHGFGWRAAGAYVASQVGDYQASRAHIFVDLDRRVLCLDVVAKFGDVERSVLRFVVQNGDFVAESPRIGEGTDLTFLESDPRRCWRDDEGQIVDFDAARLIRGE